MSKIEVRNGKLLKLIDHVGARGGLNVEEAHAIGNIAACYVLRGDLIRQGIPLLASRVQEENRKLMTVVDMIDKRGGLDATELVMKNMRVFEPGDIVKLQSPLYMENPVGIVIDVLDAVGGWQSTDVEWWSPLRQDSIVPEWPRFANSRHLRLYLGPNNEVSNL